jgi:hypothetical protein
MNPESNERTAVARIPAELEALQPLVPDPSELLPLVPQASRSNGDYLRAGFLVA